MRSTDRTDQRKVLVLHLAAPNDTNGNPRRLFVVLSREGETLATIDEGYLGSAAWRGRFPNGTESLYVGITPREYRDRLRGARS